MAEKIEADPRFPGDPDFSGVFNNEADEINVRRATRGRPPVSADAVSRADKAPIGLALSGGGIRSASVCMGAIQALQSRKRLNSIDYLSTVSGGGYTGACLSAAMSNAGGGDFPFGEDIFDSRVVRHIRNYSNYLLPRSRSALRNYAEAAAILLRGLLANAVCVLAFLLLAVALTALAFPNDKDLGDANFLPRLLLGLVYFFGALYSFLVSLFSGERVVDAFHAIWTDTAVVGTRHLQWPFAVPFILGLSLIVLLIVWAMLRSNPKLDRMTSDTSSVILKVAHSVLVLTLVTAFLDLQPILIGWWEAPPQWLPKIGAEEVKAILAGLGTFAGAVSAFASALSKFLQTSKRSQRYTTAALRGLTHLVLLIAALVLPVLIWLGYLALSAQVIPNQHVPHWADARLLPDSTLGLVLLITVASWIIMSCLRANGYSLHRLYRDRLSKAFLVSPDDTHPGIAGPKLLKWAKKLGDLPPLDEIKLSALAASKGPYPLINAALNVQGSLRANKRGRNADFFTFTPHTVGSHLTGYVPTSTMEEQDRRLDLASAVAISGAAASANMGSNTVRALSPTLSLLNVRLGYYLSNPKYIREGKHAHNRFRRYLQERADRFYLFIEMFNGLTEDGSTVYLTDGGHIENLGIYALLKRRCGLIFAIDSEADPELSCESLLKLERYARIDLGVRIVLPWEEIASHSRKILKAIPEHKIPCDNGPHCAIGRIFYPDKTEGLLVYVKSSLSGDEKDYILDYAERNPDFPHESTGDQFFSEEQFEMYRALGFHMVDGLFGEDKIGFLAEEGYGFADEAAAKAALSEALPISP